MEYPLTAQEEQSTSHSRLSSMGSVISKCRAGVRGSLDGPTKHVRKECAAINIGETNKLSALVGVDIASATQLWSDDHGKTSWPPPSLKPSVVRAQQERSEGGGEGDDETVDETFRRNQHAAGERPSVPVLIAQEDDLNAAPVNAEDMKEVREKVV